MTDKKKQPKLVKLNREELEHLLIHKPEGLLDEILILIAAFKQK